MGGERNEVRAPRPTAAYGQLASRPIGKQIHSIYRDRLRQFTDDGQYKSSGLLAKLYDARLSGEPHVKLSVWDAPGLSRPSFAEATDDANKYRKTKVGDTFGPSWSTHWFKVEFRLPADLDYKGQLELHWDANNEGMVWTDDGKPLQGLTGGGERVEWILPLSYRKPDKWYTIYVEMACNGMFGNGDGIQPPDPNKYFMLSEADIVSVDLNARALYYDFWIIGDAAREFPEDSWEQHEALQVCNEIMDCFIAGDGSRSAIHDCRAIAKRYLGNDIDSAKVYDNEHDADAIVNAIGNCHIDTCWLWPWAETKRKIARSWSNQCDLLDRYPEHRFVASQAQQFKWLEKYYPFAFDRVKDHIKKGNFMPIGGSWVEHDTNMPSGESLVRQFVYGQRYFESRFGQRCRTFWLPDTFGYSTQLPQLCRLAGMDYFFTQKLSWNNINSFPHTTFNWVALDGSQVICHMAPCETYTAEAHFGDVRRSVTQHKSLDQDATSLLPFGKGDGGGGPTFGHIEKLRRCRGLADKTSTLLPRVRICNDVDRFFDRIKDKQVNGDVDLVTWYGELYFELHRGTYTSQSNNKRNNRRIEVLLHDIEYFATLATIESGKYRYPKKKLDEMWEDVLLCQFHDCLPGSCIEMCYRDSDELYEKVFKIGDGLLDDALEALGFDNDPARKFSHLSHPLNSLGWHQPSQELKPGTVVIDKVADDVYVLDNGALKVKVENGVITSLYDQKARREVLPKGSKANQFVIFDDKPLYWQAWDVEVFHLRSRQELSATNGSSEISAQTAHRVAVSTRTKISAKSSIYSTISLCAVTDDGTPSMVETSAVVDWHEDKKFLKVEFPTTITNTEAAYETQYGIVRRPTHYNTSWDMAKFEVCCHKWADLSEHGYGVSIINDSKYGFATAGSLMRLSLLRAPKAPDAHADMGTHDIRWAIMPHAGPLDHRTVRAGIAFNQRIDARPHPRPQTIKDLMNSFKLTAGSSPSLIVDTIKRGEDDEDASNGDMPAKKGRHVILRVYDSLGGLSRGTIGLAGVQVSKAWKCNLLEDEVEQMELGKAGLDIELRAFEVATFKLLLA